MATLTRNLKLRLSEDLSNDARYNLERIDQLGSTFNINTNNNTVVRAAGDIQLRPQDNSVGGDGTGGTVEFGAASQPLDSAIINGPLKLLSVDSTHYLSLINSGTSNTSLTINTGAASRLLTLGGDVSTSGGNISLVASGNQTVNLPITNSEVANAAAIAGSKISPIFGNQLVSTEQGLNIVGGTYTTSIRQANSPSTNVIFRLPANNGVNNYVLTTDGAGNTNWSSLIGTGTVTSVDMTVPNILTISGNPVTTSGTLALGLASQSANLVLAGPASGSAAAPAFRQLSSDELVAGSTNKFYTSTLFNNDLATKTTTNLAEGTNLYHTSLRAQNAVGAIVADTATAELTYVPGTSFSVDVLPAGIDHNSLLNYSANKHVDHTAVSISTATNSGLSGGGDISSTRSISISPTNAPSKSSPVSNDVILIADSEDSNSLKKITLSGIVNLSGGSYASNWTSGLSITLTHNLNTRDVLIEVYDNATYETVQVDVVRDTTNAVTLTASEAPTGAGLRVLIKKI